MRTSIVAILFLAGAAGVGIGWAIAKTTGGAALVGLVSFLLGCAFLVNLERGRE